MADYSNDPHQNPYWQNINDQNNGSQPQGWENRQNTRSTDPHWHPEDNLGRQLGKTAQTFGLCSLISCLLFPVVIPTVLGGIAIVLAIISKGRGTTYGKNARNAIIMGIITMVISLSILAAGCLQIYQALTNEDSMNELNELMEDTYGYSFEDMLESYGYTLDGGDTT